MFDRLEELRAAHNSSGNATSPFNAEEAQKQIFLEWMKGENLPELSFIIYLMVKFILICSTYALHYAFWQVIYPLAIIEAPQTSFHNDRAPSDNFRKKGEALSITHESYITSDLRRTFIHLYKRAGATSSLRGLAAYLFSYVVFGIAITTTIGFAGIITRTAIYETTMVTQIVGLLITIALTSLDVAHTHVVITEPTFRVFFRRIPPFINAIKRTWVATLLHSATSELAYWVPVFLLNRFGIPVGASGAFGFGNWTLWQIVQFWTIWILGQACKIGLAFPADLILTRFHASLLPEEEETIVPMNRSLDKHAAPGLLRLTTEKSRTPSVRHVWKSFDRADLIRFMKLYLQFVAVTIAVRAAFWPYLGKEAWPHRLLTRLDLWEF